MKILPTFLSCLILFLPAPATAHVSLAKAKQKKSQPAQWRGVCANSTSQIDQSINNVRARLLGGGDCWWNLSRGRYIVPKVDISKGEKEVSAIFGAGLWMGGIDPAGNLKLACQMNRFNGQADFWPGPIDDQTHITDEQTCHNWDKHFRVTADEIRLHLAQIAAGDLNAAHIPQGVKGWPARGNPFFVLEHQFFLPNSTGGLASFFDADGDGNYNPLMGDYPSIEIRGCPPDRYPSEMIFWIFNDEGAGAIHGQTNGNALQIEVQVQAFGYQTNDEINDMTFQRYKMISRSEEQTDSTFFAFWIDPQLGCWQDDYVGCDTSNSMMYVYNQDATDGQPGCSCLFGNEPIPTYCNEVPMLGIDFFRGPNKAISFYDFGTGEIKDTMITLGMTNFMYFNAIHSDASPGTIAPAFPVEFYNYLTGSWRDGTRLTYGGTGYNIGSANYTNFALPSAPNDPTGWSMCNAGLDFGNRQTLQSSGPFLLKPGAINELIIGVPWVPDVPHPCPDLEYLKRADRKAQQIFNDCFNMPEGPNPPEVGWIELHQQLIAVLSNENPNNNNFQEQFTLADYLAPDSLRTHADPAMRAKINYVFEGYKIFQLINADVSPDDFNNPDLSRLVYQVDKKNGVSRIFNWEETVDPAYPDNPRKKIYYPVEQVNGNDNGIRHTFSFQEDKFATGNVRTLINHRRYYYAVVAYAHNNFGAFEQVGEHLVGQQKPYLEGRYGVQIYTVIPRPVVDQHLMASYGDGVEVTRLEGVGSGGQFLEISEEQRDALLTPGFLGELTYLPGKSPLNITVFNPFEVKEGEFEIVFEDSNNNDTLLDKDARWVLKQKNENDDFIQIAMAQTGIDAINEQIFDQLGISITIVQQPETGSLTQSINDPSVLSPGPSNGAIGATTDWGNHLPWLTAIPDQESGIFNFIKTGKIEKDYPSDPNQQLSQMGNGNWVPYPLVSGTLSETTSRLITPAWTGRIGGTFYNDKAMGLSPGSRNFNFELLYQLPNVDIVFTPDKSKWSRCVVLETASAYYTGNLPEIKKDAALQTESGLGYSRQSFDLRYGLSVGKDDNNGDGLPDPDNTIEPDSLPDPTVSLPNKKRLNPIKGEKMRGMGWFPGFAVDVETGQRLNIFFGENSCYSAALDAQFTGRDMLWNPTNQVLANRNTTEDIFNYLLGGQHWIYVCRTPYDECSYLRTLLQPDYWTNLSKLYRKESAIQQIAWVSTALTAPGAQLSSLKNGLVPHESVVSLRVQNPFQVKVNTGNGHPRYRFRTKGQSTKPLDAILVEKALDSVSVVPNPYLVGSDYESNSTPKVVKIINLPPRCIVGIYDLGGRMVRQFKVDEKYDLYHQIAPAIEWDLTDYSSTLIPSGVYLIHINAYEKGERVLKWFAAVR